MALDGLVFYYLFFYKFVVTVGFVRYKVSVIPRIFDDVLMNEVDKEGVFKFVLLGQTKNWIVLCESHQDWF